MDGVAQRSPPNERITMSDFLRRVRHGLSGLVAEDRPGFKRVDDSPARYDDGSWLTPRR
jgi:hypothetical protein